MRRAHPRLIQTPGRFEEIVGEVSLSGYLVCCLESSRPRRDLGGSGQPPRCVNSTSDWEAPLGPTRDRETDQMCRKELGRRTTQDCVTLVCRCILREARRRYLIVVQRVLTGEGLNKFFRSDVAQPLLEAKKPSLVCASEHTTTFMT